MTAVTKLNAQTQDAESTQGEVGHHNVTRRKRRKSQEASTLPVYVSYVNILFHTQDSLYLCLFLHDFSQTSITLRQHVRHATMSPSLASFRWQILVTWRAAFVRTSPIPQSNSCFSSGTLLQFGLELFLDVVETCLFSTTRFIAFVPIPFFDLVFQQQLFLELSGACRCGLVQLFLLCVVPLSTFYFIRVHGSSQEETLPYLSRRLGSCSRRPSCRRAPGCRHANESGSFLFTSLHCVA